MITARATEADVKAMYAQMRAEGLLGRVLHNDVSFEAFADLAARELFFVEKEAGDIAGFWWLTPFYGTAMCLHGCAFKKHRRVAAVRVKEAFARLAAQGVTDIYAFAQNRDVALFLKRLGFKPVSSINKEITVLWAILA